MKKRWKLLLLIAAAAVMALVWWMQGTRPFRNLEAEDIAAASIELLPPDQTIAVENLEELTGYLQQLVIYQPDQSYSEYAGQAVVVTLEMKDGSRMEIVEYNPFVIIDGVGYRCKYEPSEQLNRYANQLLEKSQ